MSDLFQQSRKRDDDYSAKHIEVLEGLEPVRRRPGMYIGGTDERALHHLAAEVLDNSMDEAVAGFANRIEMELAADGTLTVRDNGRGIPIDRHPKFKDKTALEVILTTLHSGGKFSNKVYRTAGGLHGVGISVVNALSEHLTVEIARDRELWAQTYSRGDAVSRLRKLGAAPNRRGTSIAFRPDPEIFGGDAGFVPARLYRMARSKAFLYRGVEIRWRCDPGLLPENDDTPASDDLHFPGGLADFLKTSLEDRNTVTLEPFVGQASMPENGKHEGGRVEWAIAWPSDGRGFMSSYCNTIPTPNGGTHEAGLRAALTRGLKSYADLSNNRRAGQITADDLLGGACALLSVFIPEPEFQGQTKERLSSSQAARLVEGLLKDHFEHWLSAAPDMAKALLAEIIARADERRRRREEREIGRKTATRKLRLPGKLADCSRSGSAGTEIFIVEGDSAGGSAKQARDRATQAILPLRGKILNVASAGSAKISANQELSDLIQALGCGTGSRYRESDLRYEKVVIMTDADVDGAHIASLLMTFFHREMPELIDNGHLYLALPPLYRLSQGGRTAYARDDADRARLMETEFKGRGKVDVSRFKGLGEMTPAQLRDTTMRPNKRTLQQVRISEGEAENTGALVERLMGRKPELRFAYIQEHAAQVEELDI